MSGRFLPMLSRRTRFATQRKSKLKETGEFKSFATRFGPGFPPPRREQLETRQNKRGPAHDSLGRKTYSASGSRIWTKRRCLAKRYFLRQRLIRQVHHLRRSNRFQSRTFVCSTPFCKRIQ